MARLTALLDAASVLVALLRVKVAEIADRRARPRNAPGRGRAYGMSLKNGMHFSAFRRAKSQD